MHFKRTQDFENGKTNVSRNKRIERFNKGGVQMTLKVISYASTSRLLKLTKCVAGKKIMIHFLYNFQYAFHKTRNLQDNSVDRNAAVAQA